MSMSTPAPPAVAAGAPGTAVEQSRVGGRRPHRQADRVDEAPPPAIGGLLLVGLDHSTAGIELRERLAFSDADIPAVLRRLTERLLEQAAILSTCNRVELYGVARWPRAADELASFVALDRGVASEELTRALYVHRGGQAALRLAATAAGLHSQVLGETQIQGQVRKALDHALTAGTAGPELRRMFESAIAAGRRVRTRTAIARGAASVPAAGVDLARQRLGGLAGSSVLIIGTGSVGELAAKQLVERGAKRLLVSGRDRTRAERLASAYGGQAIPVGGLTGAVAQADVVITATGAPHHTLCPHHLGGVSRPLLVIDLSVPRNVDPAVARRPGVELHTVDDLRSMADRALERRRAELPRAQAILSEEVARFIGWLRRREALV